MHSLPEFPWDSLAPYKERASSHAGGLVDLSVGTPVDPTPDVVRAALTAAALIVGCFILYQPSNAQEKPADPPRAESRPTALITRTGRPFSINLSVSRSTIAVVL